MRAAANRDGKFDVCRDIVPVDAPIATALVPVDDYRAADRRPALPAHTDIREGDDAVAREIVRADWLRLRWRRGRCGTLGDIGRWRIDPDECLAIERGLASFGAWRRQGHGERESLLLPRVGIIRNDVKNARAAVRPC